MKIFNNKKILVTGGTGSFGKYFVKKVLAKSKPKEIIIYSRDEMKQWIMQNQYPKNKILKFVIGDVRDSEKLNEECKNVNLIIHAAATKIVPTAEYNPEECIKTNINGAMNVIKAANLNKVSKVLALSTDKACNPVNLYGATKLASDKLFIAANNKKNHESKFAVVRYGNVMGSRGSVIPFFLSLKEKKYFPITNLEMTRFMISLNEAVMFVFNTISLMRGGEIFVKKIPSMKVTDIARAINPKKKLNIIGEREGEKIHEQMITVEDSKNTIEMKDFFIIKSSKSYVTPNNSKKVKTGFYYDSLNNNKWMSVKYLENWIKKNKSDFE